MDIDMQHQTMGYDRTATMFSPDGHLLQVEYAEKTIRLGSSSIGMVCTDGVFILADKRTEDRLIVPSSASKINEIDSHIIASVAGIMSDARVLIDKAQVSAQQHRVTYDSPVEPEAIIKEISDTKQQFTQYGGARPFGAAIMIGGVANKKSKLFTSDVTGNYFSYFANAIGENDDKIKEELRKEYRKDFTINKGVKTAIEILKRIQGEKFNAERLELVFIKNETEKLERVSGEKLKDFDSEKKKE